VLKPRKIDGPCNSRKPKTRRYVKPGNFTRKESIATPPRREQGHASNSVRLRRIVWERKRKPELLKKLVDLKRRGKMSEGWRRD
jgi:hypothetical protein